MDDNSRRWLAANSDLSREGKVAYIKRTAEAIYGLLTDEANIVARYDEAIDVFEGQLCDSFNQMAAALLGEPLELFTGMDWERTIDWCSAELGEEMDGTDPE